MRFLPLLGVVPVALLSARWLSGRDMPVRPEQPSHCRLIPPPIDLEREIDEALAVGDGRDLTRRVQRARMRIVGGGR